VVPKIIKIKEINISKMAINPKKHYLTRMYMVKEFLLAPKKVKSDLI